MRGCLFVLASFQLFPSFIIKCKRLRVRVRVRVLALALFRCLLHRHTELSPDLYQDLYVYIRFMYICSTGLPGIRLQVCQKSG